MSLTPFTFEGQQVNAVSSDTEGWLVGTDVARALGYANPSDALARVHPDDKRTATLALSEGSRIVNRERTLINESGVYFLVLGSTLASARSFQRWITSEVLPSIRKTGSYSVTPTPALTDDEIMHQALVISTQRVQALTATIEQQGARLALVEPKASAFDRWLSSNVDYPVSIVANALAGLGADIGRNRLFDWLAAAGWIYRTPPKGQWHPKQAQIETGRLSVRLGQQLDTRSGQQFATFTVRITPKGAVEIGRRLGLLPEAVAEALANAEEVAA